MALSAPRPAAPHGLGFSYLLQENSPDPRPPPSEPVDFHSGRTQLPNGRRWVGPAAGTGGPGRAEQRADGCPCPWPSPDRSTAWRSAPFTSCPAKSGWAPGIALWRNPPQTAPLPVRSGHHFAGPRGLVIPPILQMRNRGWRDAIAWVLDPGAPCMLSPPSRARGAPGPGELTGRGRCFPLQGRVKAAESLREDSA